MNKIYKLKRNLSQAPTVIAMSQWNPGTHSDTWVWEANPHAHRNLNELSKGKTLPTPPYEVTISIYEGIDVHCIHGHLFLHRCFRTTYDLQEGTVWLWGYPINDLSLSGALVTCQNINKKNWGKKEFQKQQVKSFSAPPKQFSWNQDNRSNEIWCEFFYNTHG